MARRWIASLAVLMLLPGTSVRSQGTPSRVPGADSVEVRPSPAPRLIGGTTDTIRSVPLPRKSPGTAMLLSAMLPGAGQFYNHSYWKVPVVLGFGLYFVSSWLDNNRRYEDYQEKYAASILKNPAGDPILLNVREFYKEQRDSFTWYFFLLYFISIADAYVDASLYDFNVGGDLSLRVLPPLPGPAVGIRFTF
jgi:hypothetical protein